MKKLGSLVMVVLCFGALMITGCEKKPVVANEKYISLHYKGSLPDGREFDSSEGKDPLAFIYGVGMMIPGFEQGISGMRAGDRKTILVKAEDAYGPYRDELVMPMPRNQIPPDFVPEIGMEAMVQTPFGPQAVRIKDITDTEIFIDYNNPLAGQDLTFDVEILEIRDPTQDELTRLMPGQPEGVEDFSELLAPSAAE